MAEEKRFIHEDIQKLDISEEEKWKKEQQRRKKLRNEITHKLRFQILNRDKFTCFYCGKSRKAYPDLVLEVDHLKPLDSGGDNSPENLVTACWECNEGKKNAHLDSIINVNKYNLHIEEIIEAAESDNHEKIKLFLTNPAHEDDRRFLYDLWDGTGRRCPKDCNDCTITGLWVFLGCMQALYRHVKKIDKKQLIPADTSVPRVDRKPNMQLTKSLNNTLQCETCYIATRCPEYRVGQSCAFNLSMDLVSPEKPEDVMKFLVLIQQERVLRGQFFEKIDGGALDKNVSQEISLLQRLLVAQKELKKSGASVTISAEGTGDSGTDLVGEMLQSIFKPEKTEKKIPDAEEADYEETDNNEDE